MLTDIIQSVHDNVKLLEEGEGKSCNIHDVAYMCDNLGRRVHRHHSLRSNFGLELANVVLAEEELAVQIAQLNSVKIDLHDGQMFP